MPLLGLNQPAIELQGDLVAYEDDDLDDDGIGIEVAPREDDAEFTAAEGPAAVQGKATKRVLARLYDEWGNIREVHRGAVSYYLGKRKRDPITGKLGPVFWRGVPPHLRDPKTGKLKAMVEGVDFVPCPICLVPVRLDQNLRREGAVPDRTYALKVARDEHIRVTHPRQYIYYADDAIRDRRDAITKKK